MTYHARGIPSKATPRSGVQTIFEAGCVARTDEHVDWRTPFLNVGDSVRIDLVEVDEFDRETKRYTIPGNQHTSELPAKAKGRRQSKPKNPKAGRKK